MQKEGKREVHKKRVHKKKVHKMKVPAMIGAVVACIGVVACLWWHFSKQTTEISSPESTAEPKEAITLASTAVPRETATPEPANEPRETTTPEPAIELRETTTPESAIEPRETATPEPAIELRETTTPEPATKAREKATPKPSTAPREITPLEPSTAPSTAPSTTPTETVPEVSMSSPSRPTQQCVHDYNTPYIEYLPASCTHSGEGGHYCSKCGGIQCTEILPMKPHSFVFNRVLQEGNCILVASVELQCSVCGLTKTVADSDKQYVSYDHDWVKRQATLIDPDTGNEYIDQYVQCSVCGRVLGE